MLLRDGIELQSSVDHSILRYGSAKIPLHLYGSFGVEYFSCACVTCLFGSMLYGNHSVSSYCFLPSREQTIWRKLCFSNLVDMFSG